MLVHSIPNGTNVTTRVYRKLAGGSEPATYVFGYSFNVKSAVAVAAYTGVDPTTPVEVFVPGTNASGHGPTRHRQAPVRVTITIGDATQPAAGASGTATATSASVGVGAHITLALKPAAAGGSTTTTQRYSFGAVLNTSNDELCLRCSVQ